MKKIGIILFCSIICIIGFGQTKMDKIKELMELTDVNDLVDQMLGGSLNLMESQLSQQYTDEVKRKQVTDIIVDETKKMANNLVLVDMPDIYDQLFDESDIDAFIDFYKTEAGQKLLELTPKINEQILSKLMTSYLPELQTSVMSRINSLD